MKKSIEERLSNIEDGIAKLMEMQHGGFVLLSASVRLLDLYERTQWIMTNTRQSLDPLHRHIDFMRAVLFGSMGYVGVGISLFALAHAVNDSFFKAIGITFFAIAIGCYFYAAWQNRGARRALCEVESKLTKIEPELERMEDELNDVEDGLEKAGDKWEGLIEALDDRANELGK